MVGALVAAAIVAIGLFGCGGAVSGRRSAVAEEPGDPGGSPAPEPVPLVTPEPVPLVTPEPVPNAAPVASEPAREERLLRITADIVRGRRHRTRCVVGLRVVTVDEPATAPDPPVVHPEETIDAEIDCYAFTMFQMMAPSRMQFHLVRSQDGGLEARTTGGRLLGTR